MAQYRVLVGIDYPPNKRAEIGDIVSDLPGNSIKGLLQDGVIESTDKKSSTPIEEVVTTPEEVIPVIEETPVSEVTE